MGNRCSSKLPQLSGSHPSCPSSDGGFLQEQKHNSFQVSHLFAIPSVYPQVISVRNVTCFAASASAVLDRRIVEFCNICISWFCLTILGSSVQKIKSSGSCLHSSFQSGESWGEEWIRCNFSFFGSLASFFFIIFLDAIFGGGDGGGVKNVLGLGVNYTSVS